MKDEFDFFENKESDTVQRIKNERVNRGAKSYRQYLEDAYGPRKARSMLRSGRNLIAPLWRKEEI